jgi:hypothetical protein
MGMTLNSNTTLAYAITAILGGSSGLAYADAPYYATFVNADQFIKEDFVGRPRTIGVKFGYKF